MKYIFTGTQIFVWGVLIGVGDFGYGFPTDLGVQVDGGSVGG